MSSRVTAGPVGLASVSGRCRVVARRRGGGGGGGGRGKEGGGTGIWTGHLNCTPELLLRFSVVCIVSDLALTIAGIVM